MLQFSSNLSLPDASCLVAAFRHGSRHPKVRGAEIISLLNSFHLSRLDQQQPLQTTIVPAANSVFFAHHHRQLVLANFGIITTCQVANSDASHPKSYHQSPLYQHYYAGDGSKTSD
jgi:hypothetical protein